MAGYVQTGYEKVPSSLSSYCIINIISMHVQVYAKLATDCTCRTHL